MTVTVTWHGHATLSMKVNDYRIVIDPFFTDNPMAQTSADNVAADFMLISHGHGDHIADAMSIALGSRIIGINNDLHMLTDTSTIQFSTVSGRTRQRHIQPGCKPRWAVTFHRFTG